VPFATNFRELALSVGNGMRRCRGDGERLRAGEFGWAFQPSPPAPLPPGPSPNRGRGESEGSNIFAGMTLSRVVVPREARVSSRLNIRRWKVED
jgi:hypothetical protein